MSETAEPLLAVNVMHFGRLLRRAGLPVGAAEVLAGQEALTLVDIGDRDQVQMALRSAMVHRHEHRPVFDMAFRLFWRDAGAARQAAMQALINAQKPPPQPRQDPGSRRVAEAFSSQRDRAQLAEDEPPEFDAALTFSDRERLQTMDFEAMSAAEIGAAKAEIRRLVLPLDTRRTRRQRPDPSGGITDLRRTLRSSLRRGGEILDIAKSRRVERPPPLVVLCDISGSMARYSQILLHFLHAVANLRDRVQVFLFGTRLTNVTRQLRHRDPEVAFQLIAHVVPDWSGGTRIGESLAEFNHRWAKRVLGQGAIVLLVTDGLDRPREGQDRAKNLGESMDRLHRSSRRLVWLNPLLRWQGFEPKSQGIRAMLPHVDEFRPVHNLASLRELVDLLSKPPPARAAMQAWRTAA
jgi:uncharacterized protein with von Willebrand factor type A (vWA) domain